MRHALALGIVGSGCVLTHVVAVDDRDVGDGSTGTGAGAEESAGADASVGSTDEACSLPESVADCDSVDPGPLFSLELACDDSVVSTDFRSQDPRAWRRAVEFGNAFWTSETSSSLLVLSTGAMPAAGPAGQVALEPRAAQDLSVDNDNPDGVELPPPIVPEPGSESQPPFVDCDGQGDCSQTLSAQWESGGMARDLIWFQFVADVPSDAHSYRVKVGFVTAEYPERIDAPANDMFVWWSDGEAFVGNLATFNGQPATVTGLASRLHEISGDHPMLLRVGVDGSTDEPCTVNGVEQTRCPVGASTGWMELSGPVVPGEQITIVAALFEQGDSSLDTMVVLDDWRWRCEPCTPGQTCGLQ